MIKSTHRNHIDDDNNLQDRWQRTWLRSSSPGTAPMTDSALRMPPARHNGPVCRGTVRRDNVCAAGTAPRRGRRPLAGGTGNEYLYIYFGIWIHIL